MKKRMILPMLTLISLMSACSNNTIAEAELTSREDYILMTTADQSFVYDFNLGNESKEAEIWVERYEFGELVEPSVSKMWTDVEGEGFILFSLSDTHVNSNEKRIEMGIFGESGGGSGTSIDEIIAQEVDGGMTTWQSVVTDAVNISEGDITLGSLSISTSDSMKTLSPEFFEDIEGNSQEIQDYDVVYIFKANFSDVVTED